MCKENGTKANRGKDRQTDRQTTRQTEGKWMNPQDNTSDTSDWFGYSVFLQFAMSPSYLQDLTNLSGLQNLRKLSFRDPQFAPSPVSLQCNYATHVLYHIPQLTHLDTFSVTSPALKEVVHVSYTSVLLILSTSFCYHTQFCCCYCCLSHIAIHLRRMST